MSYKKFLIPVGVAVAALTANGAHALQNPIEKNNIPSDQRSSTVAAKESSDPVFKKLLYQLGEEEHALLLRKPASGLIYADHASHSSHASHASHASHRSGY